MEGLFGTKITAEKFISSKNFGVFGKNLVFLRGFRNFSHIQTYLPRSWPVILALKLTRYPENSKILVPKQFIVYAVKKNPCNNWALLFKAPTKNSAFQSCYYKQNLDRWFGKIRKYAFEWFIKMSEFSCSRQGTNISHLKNVEMKSQNQQTK